MSVKEDGTSKSFTYDFGNNYHEHTSKQPFSYTGYQVDPVSKTYFAQARHYDPMAGRFVSQDTHWNPNNMIYGDKQTYSEVPHLLRGLAPDPLAIGQSSNLYSYTLNNPVNNIDLNGEALISGTIAVVGVGLKLTGIGFGIGATVGVAGQLTGDLVTSAVNQEWTFSSWESYVGAGAGGGTAGATTALFGFTNPAGLGALAGGVSTATTQGLENWSGTNRDRTGGDIAFNSVWSAGEGALFGWAFDFIKIPGINSGRGNQDASYRGVLTRIRNGNAQNVGRRTINNGLSSGVIGGSGESILGGILGSDLVEGFWQLVSGNDSNKSLNDIAREGFMNFFTDTNNIPMEFDFSSCE